MKKKIQVLSDLHCEFHRDLGVTMVNSLVPEGVDFLLLAGDITLAHTLSYLIPRFCERFSSSQVIFVPGNHEYYHSSPEKVRKILDDIEEGTENLHVLWNQEKEIDGVKFIGGTLWFPDNPMNPLIEYQLADFSQIRDFKPWVYRDALECYATLIESLSEEHILITHHLPSHKSVAPEWRGSDLNNFFVYDIEELLLERQPRLAIHGHTHTSCDYSIRSTRVVCNPMGYLPGINPKWSERLIIEV